MFGGSFSLRSPAILDTGADTSVIRLPKDFYDKMNHLSFTGNLPSFDLSFDTNIITATGEESPAMIILRINGHKPCIDLGHGSGRPVFVESLLLLPLSPDLGDAVSLKHAQGLIGRDVLCQYKFKLKLIDRMYEMCFDFRRAEALVTDDDVEDVEDETEGWCGWNSFEGPPKFGGNHSFWLEDLTFA